MIWLLASGTIGIYAVAAHGPSLKTWHRRIIKVRALHMLLGEMWAGALARRDRWPECLERAKFDV